MFKLALTVLFVASWLAGPALAAPELRLKPGSGLPQGQQLQLTLTPDDSTGPFTATIAGKKIELFEQDGKYVAYLALPSDQKPGGYTLNILDGKGQSVTSQKIEVQPMARSSQNIRFYSPNLTPAQQKQLDAEEALVDIARSSRTEEQYFKGPFMLPVPHRVSSVYGVKRYLNGKYNGYHGGVDFLTPMGFAIKAPGAGRVTLARYFAKFNSNGNTVFLDHGHGITSVYLHLSKILVKEGQMVAKGEPVGLCGSTGRSTGPHLHWGMYVNGQNTDGLGWVKFSQSF